MAMLGAPETKYAKSGNISIAYQVIGDGPRDILFVPGAFSHLDLQWEDPDYAEWMTRLSGFCRLILFDKRGTGLSDRDVGESTLEERMDDLRAVLDAAGSRQCTVIAMSEGGALSMLFSATYPERVSRLIVFGVSYCLIDDPGFLPGMEQRRFSAMAIEYISTNWGKGQLLSVVAPSSMPLTPELFERMGRFERASASPRSAINHVKWQLEMDLRPVAKSLHVPTLIMHCSGDKNVPVGASRWLAKNVEGARYIELPGDYHWPWFEPDSAVMDAIEEFVTGERSYAEVDRILATVLFTDIVGSTERAAAAGDHQWRNLLDRHHIVVRKELTRFRGREINTTGDGFFAAFDGPARAVRCAAAIRDAVKPLGIEIRAGVHTGECERVGEDLAGIAVHTGARVLSCAGPSEVWVSGTVRDLVAGSGLNFEDRGTRPLKGIPGEWRLFAVA
jgi:pimeloyl-ACP methyl ester carboxylesterase